jgi:hypothetical protein
MEGPKNKVSEKDNSIENDSKITLEWSRSFKDTMKL